MHPRLQLFSPRLTNLIRCLGPASVQKIQDARILVIGAGGIGCELLKNLVLAGFTDIEVVDLDTIDVSNLNRQFLFRKKDVGKPKSTVARESVLRFNPAVKMVSHYGNVKNGDIFNTAFIQQFTVVANALDNVGARRHVNRLCVKAGVPLVESGSTGYLGQASVHYGGVCECYDCVPHATPKKFPICTIRSTPDKPVHCIEWAKQLFTLLFGVKENSMLSDSAEGGEGGEGGADKAAAADATSPTSDESATEAAIQRPTVFDASTLRQYASGILRAFYDTEIQKNLAMKTYKTAEHTPAPINFDALGDFAAVDVTALMGTGGSVLQQKVLWSIDQNAAVFVRCMEEFWNEEKRSGIGAYDFDKDDRTALDFVVAASNLRAHVFSIPLQSTFGVKQIAGNIVHAIATTNAMAAGLEVLELMKIVTISAEKQIQDPEISKPADWNDAQSGEWEAPLIDNPAYKEELLKRCTSTSIFLEPTRKGYVLVPVKLEPPSKKCAVCQEAGAIVTLDVHKTTLSTFISSVVKAKLGFSEPEFDVGNDPKGVWIYPDDYEDDGGADAFDHIMIDQLPALGGGIQDGSMVKITDLIQGLKVDVKVVHQDEEEFDKDKHPEYLFVKFCAKKEEGSEQKEGDDANNEEDDDGMEIVEEEDDDVVMIVENPQQEQEQEKKRNENDSINDDDDTGEPAKKRCKVDQ